MQVNTLGPGRCFAICIYCSNMHIFRWLWNLFPNLLFWSTRGSPYNQEYVSHETQGWCASPVLRVVNGRLMSEWNTGSCGGNLNLCIKILITVVTPILNLSNKIPYGVSVPYRTEAWGLLGPLLSLSITLIDGAPPTALISGQFILSASLPGSFLQCFWPVPRLIPAALKLWGLPDGNTSLVPHPLLCNSKLWSSDQLLKAVTFSLTHFFLACFFSLSCVLHSQFVFLGFVFQRNSLDSSPCSRV